MGGGFIASGWTLPLDILCLVEERTKSGKDGNVDLVMSRMMSMMNTLCQALTPKVTPCTREKTSRIISYDKGSTSLSKTIK